MRLRHIKGSEEMVANSPLCLIKDESLPKKTNSSIFNNDNSLLYLELGMGKGKFIINNALQYKNINFIGVEKYATVILSALKNYELYCPKDTTNLRFLCLDAKELDNFFENESIDKLFLNFSDPWPKKRHENRRLTSKLYIDIYKKILKNNKNIELKTDNIDFFEYSIESFKNNGFNIEFLTYDLHNDTSIYAKNNILTEYEDKFSKKGQKIYKFVANT